MNAHLIRIVEGPQASDSVAANDSTFDFPATITLGLVPAPQAGNPDSSEGNVDNVDPAKTTEPDDYALGGYAGI